MSHLWKVAQDASGQLERDQQFINELAKQPVVELRMAMANISLPALGTTSGSRKDS